MRNLFFFAVHAYFGRFCAKEPSIMVAGYANFSPLCHVMWSPCAEFVWAVHLTVFTANYGNRGAHEKWARSRYKSIVR